MSEAVPADASGRDSGLTAPTGDTPVGPRPRADRSPAPPAVPGGAAAPPGQSDPGALGPRATRTREAIVATARALFLDRGYAGTSVADITEACGISRAGFYTYFRHKREIFEELGRTSYQANLAVVERLGALASDWTVPQIRL